MNVGVIGAGLAGIACALGATLAGASVHIVDAASGPQRIDAHVDVVPNMLRDLAGLDVADDLVARGFPYAGTNVTDTSGRTLFRIPAPRLAGKRYPGAIGIRYQAFIDIMLEAARRAGVVEHWGEVAVRLEPPEAPSAIVLDDGRIEDLDLIVVATGSEGPLRSQVFPDAELPRHAGQVWWRTLLPRPAKLGDSVVVLGRNGDRAALVPVDLHTAGVSIWRASTDLDEAAASVIEQMRAWLKNCRGSPLQAMADHLRVDQRVFVRPVRSGVLDALPEQGRVLVVGDAAHVIAPHFGQSAAQSIEDAVVLYELLASDVPVDGVVGQFRQRRCERTRIVHDICLQATQWTLRPRPDTDFAALSDRLSAVVGTAP